MAKSSKKDRKKVDPQASPSKARGGTQRASRRSASEVRNANDGRAERTKCQGTNKKGTPCQNTARHGKKFCEFHGPDARYRDMNGRAAWRQAKRPPWAASRGLYADGLFPEEMAVFDAMEVGTLETEIKLIKVQLRRAVTAQLLWRREHEKVNELIDEDPSLMRLPAELRKHLELELYERKIGEGVDGQEIDTRKMVRRRTDYMREIKQLVKLLAELEMCNKALNAEAGLTAPETIDLLATKLREFGEASAAKMPIMGPEDSDASDDE